MIELVVFLLGSLGLIILSRQSLTLHSSHGFPRFFAFEALLGLVVLNARKWFIEPLSVMQVISWILLLGGIVVASSSFWVLRAHGSVDRSIKDQQRIAFEKTTKLVRSGPYRLIRHPLYTSLLLLALGAFLKQVSLLSGVLVLLIFLTFFLTAVYEERENQQIFGQEYTEYMLGTKRFIPWIF